jgi:tRNA pseudouridine55 synthase
MSAVPRDWAGLLPVDKPAGPTSHDVVARARRALGIRAIGHLGTLDPGASGLLVLAIGAATRCAFVWQRGAKTYEGTARFGIVTDTQDVHGRVLEESAARPGETEVRAAAATLTGEQMQVPPMVSALKVGGERLHAIARRGEVVERAARAVTIEAWEWLAIGRDEARFRVTCSGGTYVRTLVHDLGAKLGCGAALADLRRLASAPFSVEHAAAWGELDAAHAGATLARAGVPLDRALAMLPELVLDATGAAAIGHGRPVACAGPADERDATLVLRDASGRALALAEPRAGAAGAWLAQPRVVFPWAVREGSAS